MRDHRCGSTTSADLRPHLPSALLRSADGQDRVQRNFELLGAAIGDDAFAAAHTAARVSKAEPLLAALAELEDPQVGVELLRSCAGHCRLVHSIRCTPQQAITSELRRFDSLVRPALPASLGSTLTSTNGLRRHVA